MRNKRMWIGALGAAGVLAVTGSAFTASSTWLTPSDASINFGRVEQVIDGFDVMKLYDVPAPMAHIPMRQPTLNPLQALFVMNSAFIQRLANALAGQVAGEPTTEAKIQRLYRKVFARDATAEEMALGARYLATADTARYAQALLSTNEVIFWP